MGQDAASHFLSKRLLARKEGHGTLIYEISRARLPGPIYGALILGYSMSHLGGHWHVGEKVWVYMLISANRARLH